ncbi:MAG: hypothetical protein ACI3ZY_11865 [Parabacteroides sp.]
MEKRNYEQLAKAAANGIYHECVIYTGEQTADGDPVFQLVFIDNAVRVQKNGKWYWGLTVYDLEKDEFFWVDYNNCVSLEDFAVLERLLDKKFAWMKLIDGLRQRTIEKVKSMISDEEGGEL